VHLSPVMHINHNNNINLVLQPLTNDNAGELASEMFTIHTHLFISQIITLTSISLDLWFPSVTIHCII